MVNIKLFLLGNLFKIIYKFESFLYGFYFKVWEENIYNIIFIGLEVGER